MSGVLPADEVARIEAQLAAGDELVSLRADHVRHLLALRSEVERLRGKVQQWMAGESTLRSILAEVDKDRHALRSQLAAATDVIRKLRDGWTPETDDDPPVWYLESGIGDVNLQWDGTAPMTPAERAVLDAVAAPESPSTPGPKT